MRSAEAKREGQTAQAIAGSAKRRSSLALVSVVWIRSAWMSDETIFDHNAFR